MQKPYTKKAKKAMDLAAKTSKVMHHNYIGTEHILVGLLRERTGVAAKVLLDAGIEEEKLTELIEADGGKPRLIEGARMNPVQGAQQCLVHVSWLPRQERVGQDVARRPAERLRQPGSSGLCG